MRAFLLFCLLTSAIYRGIFGIGLGPPTILRSKLIDHEYVLEQNPSATELAASTLNYARTKEHGGGRFLGLG